MSYLHIPTDVSYEINKYFDNNGCYRWYRRFMDATNWLSYVCEDTRQHFKEQHHGRIPLPGVAPLDMFVFYYHVRSGATNFFTPNVVDIAEYVACFVTYTRHCAEGYSMYLRELEEGLLSIRPTCYEDSIVQVDIVKKMANANLIRRVREFRGFYSYGTFGFSIGVEQYALVCNAEVTEVSLCTVSCTLVEQMVVTNHHRVSLFTGVNQAYNDGLWCLFSEENPEEDEMEENEAIEMMRTYYGHFWVDVSFLNDGEAEANSNL